MDFSSLPSSVDNAIGPLSYMVAPPSVTKTLEMTYLRPIPPKITEIVVTAAFESENGRELIFVADVKRGDGAVLAQARAVNVMLKRSM